MNYKIQLRTSRTDYDLATNPKIYQFVAIRGSSGRSGIPPLDAPPAGLGYYKFGQSYNFGCGRSNAVVSGKG